MAVFTVLKLFGAAYLVFLGFLGGYGLLRAPPRRPVVPRQDEI